MSGTDRERPDAAILAVNARLRRQLADWLITLDDDQLDTPSLCGRWRVRDVAGHLTAAVAVPMSALVKEVFRRGGRLHRANAELAITEARRPVAELADRLRSHADTPFAPSVVGARGPLTDLLVHEGDMRLPLGLPLSDEPAATTVALGFLTGSAPGFVPRRRLHGLRLVASDLDTAWADGAEVVGSGRDLMMAVCGRTATLDRLTGPGVAALRSRIATG